MSPISETDFTFRSRAESTLVSIGPPAQGGNPLMDHWSLLVVVVVIAALAFDFTNGFHDTANAMATSVATGALPPRVAVAISGALNLVGAFLSTEVAKTI